jgi:DNA-directed RNA polymerase specialized sigma24 family protein
LLESTSLGGQALLEESLPAGELTVAQTPPSLLNRLREQPDDAKAWQRFDTLYRPLLQTWLRRYCLQPPDADDLVQQVFEVVLREMPKLHYDSENGSFRGWLRGILVNRLPDFWRSQVLNQLEDPKSDLSSLWDQQHPKCMAQRLLAWMEQDFTHPTWPAFLRIMAGERVAAVAPDLKISVNAVYLVKSSVLKRLRHEMGGVGGVVCRFSPQVLPVSVHR